MRLHFLLKSHPEVCVIVSNYSKILYKWHVKTSIIIASINHCLTLPYGENREKTLLLIGRGSNLRGEGSLERGEESSSCAKTTILFHHFQKSLKILDILISVLFMTQSGLVVVSSLI
jgi:hypothetical protein